MSDEQETLLATRSGLERLAADRDHTAESAQQRYFTTRDETAMNWRGHAQEQAAVYHELLDSQEGPYYARFDVAETVRSEPETYYLTTGRLGADTRPDGGAFVLSWDSDLARAFRGQGVTVHAREYRGEAVLRRRFSIRGGREIAAVEDLLNRYADTLESPATGDPFLRRLLRESGPRARAIVTTLAQTQDNIVFAPPTPLMVIEGVPGSGKTQLGQLRVAALVSGAQFGQATAPQDILVLAPSRALLTYLERVLPSDMHVAGVRQSDLTSLLRSYVRTVDIHEGTSNPWRGTDEFGVLIQHYAAGMPSQHIERIARAAPPQGSGWQLNKKEMLLAYTIAAGARLGQQAAAFERELLRQMEANQPKASSSRLAEIRRAVHRWYGDVLAEESLSTTYQNFLRAIGEPEFTDQSDLPALAYLRYCLTAAVPDRVRYLVIDEGQNVPPLAYRVLRRWFPDAQMLVLGDLAQGSLDRDGIQSWRDIERAGLSAPRVHSLTVNYRCAPPVVQVLNHLGKRLIPALPAMGRVDRPAPPVLAVRTTAGEVWGAIEHLLKDNPHRTAAILFRSTDAADEGYLRLADRLAAAGVKITRLDPSRSYEGGVVVAARDEVGGLEFDLVIVADTTESTYDGSPQAARDLYALISRAQNRLALVSAERPSPLLAGMPVATVTYEESGRPGHAEARWSGTGSYGRGDVGWGFNFPRDGAGRHWTGATPGMDEDRYDEESGADEARVDWYDRSSDS